MVRLVDGEGFMGVGVKSSPDTWRVPQPLSSDGWELVLRIDSAW